MPRWFIYLLIFLAALSTAYVAGGPYLAAHMINVAVDKDDATGLTEYIDFPRLEKNILEQIEASERKDAKRKRAGFFEELLRGMVRGYAVGTAAVATSPRAFGEYARNRAGKTGALFKHMRLDIDSLDQVSFLVKEPEGNERRYVFNRHKLRWKLTNIDLHDFLDAP